MPYGMARTRRSRGSKARTFHSSSPAAGSNSGSVPPAPQAGRRSAAVAAANASKSVSGRTTQNSRGNRGGRRGPTSSKRSQAISKSTNGRGRGRTAKKDANTLQDPISYRDERGEVYKKGDFAYVDSQQQELPYHICVIRDFKMGRKEVVIAEIMWFYRVSELPEAVYQLLTEDRKDDAALQVPKARVRELFMAFNMDTHPASLLRGKCKVKKLNAVRDSLATYLDKEHSFFYNFGYKPESRRLTSMSEESYVPVSQQAVLPACRCPEADTKEVPAADAKEMPAADAKEMPAAVSAAYVKEQYNSSEEKPDVYEKLVWHPKLTDEELLMYLRAARSMALHAGVCLTGYMTDGVLTNYLKGIRGNLCTTSIPLAFTYLPVYFQQLITFSELPKRGVADRQAASSDETTQHAFDVLHRNSHKTKDALKELVKRPIVSRLMNKKSWSKENMVLFGKGMRQFGKNFPKIKEMLPKKTIEELVEYYYYWKKTNAGLSSRNTRRQRKMAHIRSTRSLLKPEDTTPEREFMDWESCDDDDEFRGEKSKPRGYYACRHCYCQHSQGGWHHAGPTKTILCHTCHLYFQHYGVLDPIEVKREPPEFMFKDFHESCMQEENHSPSSGISNAAQSPLRTGRKTRNSKGSRGGTSSSRPGLRSAKPNKSDTEAEASGDSGEESSCEDDVPIPIKQKPLQAHHSLLCDLDGSASKPMSNPNLKRQKRDDNMSALSTEEYGSSDSVSGDQENDNSSSHKSPAVHEKSSGQSSSSSSTHADDEGGSPCSAQGEPSVPVDRTSTSSVPQQFERVCADSESTCARTDLVYIHPPVPVKQLQTCATKVPIPRSLGSSTHGGSGAMRGGQMLEPHNNLSSGLITHYEPQLPMGPTGYPMPPYPAMAHHGGAIQHVSPMVSIVPPALHPPPTHPFPATVGIVDPETLIKQTNMEAAPSSTSVADEHLQQQQQQQQQIALWQQHQQQQIAALHLAQLQQGHSHPLTIQTPGFMAGIHPPPHAPLSNTSTSTHAVQQPQASAEQPPPTQFQAFNFPSPEEINSRQWAEQVAIIGGGGAFWARGIHPAMITQQQQQQQQLLELYASQQLVPVTSASSTGTAIRQPTQEDVATAYLAPAAVGGGGGGAALGAHVVPMEMLMTTPGFPPETVSVNMEQLIAQQQHQHQQQQMMALALNAAESQQQQVELRRLDLLAQQVQKDPTLLQNTQCQLLLHQREQVLRHMQAQQEQHILIQQEMQKQQQQQQQFVLGRPPLGHTEEASPHPRSRPGVIVNQGKGN